MTPNLKTDCCNGQVYFNNSTGDYCCSICTDRIANISEMVKLAKIRYAAPDLLEACISAYEQMHCPPKDIWIKNKLRAAIKKATD